MTSIDLRGVMVDGSRVLARVGTDRSGVRPRPAWSCVCACGIEFVATSEHIRKVQRGSKCHRLRCKGCKVWLTPSVHRFTVEEWIAICESIIAWAKVVRRRYLDFECDCCGLPYHPRHGKKPPSERACPHRNDANCYCGHAHFRDAFGEWDRKRDDWRDDD